MNKISKTGIVSICC